MSYERAKWIAVVIGMVLAIAVSVAVLAYDKAHDAAARQRASEILQAAERKQAEAERFRTEAEVKRLAREVFRDETQAEQTRRLQRTATIAIRACAKDPKCLGVGRRVFGPSRARLLAHARFAALDYCRRNSCRGPRGRRGAVTHITRVLNRPVPGPRGPRGRPGPAGPAGPRGPRGPAGTSGASPDQVINQLCRRLPLLCKAERPR